MTSLADVSSRFLRRGLLVIAVPLTAAWIGLLAVLLLCRHLIEAPGLAEVWNEIADETGRCHRAWLSSWHKP